MKFKWENTFPSIFPSQYSKVVFAVKINQKWKTVNGVKIISKEKIKT